MSSEKPVLDYHTVKLEIIKSLIENGFGAELSSRTHVPDSMASAEYYLPHLTHNMVNIAHISTCAVMANGRIDILDALDKERPNDK